jgi:RNA polymerase sigma-70 factor (ECF subfamily)
MPYDEDETEYLVRQARQGDGRAVECLMQRYRARLKQMIRLRMDPRVSARVDPSDVIQDTLTTASQQLDEYLQTQPIPFYPWLRRIAWQKLVNAHERHLDARKRSARQEQPNYGGVSDASAMQIAKLIAGDLTSPSEAAVREETRLRVRAALAELSELDREVLLERYVEQLSVKEIAAGLGSTEAAIHMRHMRALEKLHRLVSGEGLNDD